MAPFPLTHRVGRNAANIPKEVTDVKGRLADLGFRVTNTRDFTLAPEEQPQSGFFNRELVIETSDDHDWGTSWLADAIILAAVKYRDDVLAKKADNESPNRFKALISLHDFSTPYGGATPDHSGHQTGVTADLTLPWKDGTARRPGFKSNDGRFDSDTLLEMLKAFKSPADSLPGDDSVELNPGPLERIYFTPRSSEKAKYRDAFPRTDKQLYFGIPGHRDHADIKVQPPKIEFGCSLATVASLGMHRS